MTIKKHITIFVFLLLSSLAFGQVAGDYRSVATGNWNATATWQTYSAGAWIAAASIPTSGIANVITIQSPNVVTVTAVVTIDQVVVNSGATLQNTAGIAITIANSGITTSELVVNGTFIENGTTSVIWNAGATWSLSAAGSYVKTGNTSSNNWQTNYEGGIATIPSTSNWILRKTGASAPQITTIGAIYGNLTIENNVAGIWNTSVGSTFQGLTGFPTIKGNFDLGGAGTSTVNFLNQHTFSSPTLVQGNVLIRTGNIFANDGTGLEVQGDITVSGSLNYGASNSRKLVFSGGNAQSFVASVGAANIYDMTMNKSSGALTLNRAITVDNLLTFTSGNITTTSSNLLTINTNGSVAGASNTSFVNGPIRYIGNAAFTFPVGKGSDYQALGMSASTGTSIFWTETFDAVVCGLPGNSACDPSLVGWTSVGLGGEGANANKFYVSCRENGNAAGACGSGCGSDQSLHIGNVSTSAAAGFFCPNGDCGASYDASGAGEVANKRAESPVINCTGKTNISVSFNYIENGQGASDNATFWYYNGASWAQLDDMPKVVLCAGQGTWTARTVTLPASANGNANVKIGFVWVNNADGVGTDPSFAADDITLSTAAQVDFTAEYFYADPQATFNNNLVVSLNHISMCEYWTLTRNAGTENKNITLTWDANSCGVTLLSDLRVAHWDGTLWQNEGNTATTGSTTTGTITSGVVTWFSPFTLSSISTENPLPIELLDFTAHYNSSAVELNWQTSSEVNNDYFNVERSADAKEFVQIDKVNGAGNSTTIKMYSDIDKSPLSGISYYRLKQTDFDGHYKYSKTISVNIENLNFEIVNTSVQTDQGMLEVTTNCNGNCIINFELYDMTGKKIYSLKQNMEGSSTKILIPVSTLSGGIYLLKAYNGEKLVSKKIKL